ncbi:hypothetical protein Egran_01645, partial [Elaphomyces granulatus]
HSLQLEIIAPRELSPRAQFYGGYALSSDSCPSGTDKCGRSLVNGCCPSGKSCLTFAFEAYCCPDSNDCRHQLDALPICADPSWVLYAESDLNRWCCLPGQIGVSSGVCASTDLSVPATMLASTLSQIGGIGGIGGATVTQATGTVMVITDTALRTIITSTATYGSSSSSATVSQNSSSSTSFSAAEIAGIAIGAAAGVASVIFLGWFCYWFGQRRALRKQPARVTSENPPVYVSDAASTKHHRMAVPSPHFGYQHTPEIDSYPTGGNPAELEHR